MEPIPTLRRLNDRERYWGLTFPQWAGVAIAGAFIYAAVKLSPLPTKPTMMIAVLMVGFAGTVLIGVSGQALSPLRQLQAITRYRRAPKIWDLPLTPDKQGLVLSAAPLLDQTVVDFDPDPVAILNLDDLEPNDENAWRVTE